MHEDGLDPDLVEDLRHPEAYPDDPSAPAGVETLQTHLSHLFLTRGRVVKLRKAVDLAFVDFGSRSDRIADCMHEVALNRRLAPDVYLGVAPVRRHAGRFCVRDEWLDEAASTASAEAPECVVVMRRLEDGRDAMSLLEKGELRGEDLDAAAAVLARFHDGVGLGRPAPWEPEAWWEHCFRPVAATIASLESALPDTFSRDRFEALRTSIHERFESLRPRFEERRREGRAVEGHGDVHLQHIWFEHDAPEPVLIDCVEFDPDLRRIDTASEVSFLAMDLGYRERPDLAARFLRRYATARDDFGLYTVVDAYQSYRAAVRGKVAALAALDAGIPAAQRGAARESAGRHLELAERAIRAPERGALVLVCGTVGVGKSTVAEKLADRTAGVVVSSDRTRKHLAGAGPDERRGDATDQGLYAPETTDLVYQALLDRADLIVESGRVAILDATFGRAAHRERARAWAERRGIAVHLVEVTCNEDVARERLRRREAKGTDPSDAGPGFLEVSRSRFESPEEWPSAQRSEVRTDGGSPSDALDRLAKRLVAES